MKPVVTDIDIDVPDRELVLQLFRHGGMGPPENGARADRDAAQCRFPALPRSAHAQAPAGPRAGRRSLM